MGTVSGLGHSRCNTMPLLGDDTGGSAAHGAFLVSDTAVLFAIPIEEQMASGWTAGFRIRCGEMDAVAYFASPHASTEGAGHGCASQFL